MGAAGLTPGGFPFWRPPKPPPGLARAAGRPAVAPWPGDPSIGLACKRKRGVDAGQELFAVALGKPAQMPYVWLPRRAPSWGPNRETVMPGCQIGATVDWWQFLT